MHPRRRALCGQDEGGEEGIGGEKPGFLEDAKTSGPVLRGFLPVILFLGLGPPMEEFNS